jgi:hypothetical protein
MMASGSDAATSGPWGRLEWRWMEEHRKMRAWPVCLAFEGHVCERTKEEWVYNLVSGCSMHVSCVAC